jgi:hypothetical protein
MADRCGCEGERPDRIGDDSAPGHAPPGKFNHDYPVKLEVGRLNKLKRGKGESHYLVGGGVVGPPNSFLVRSR